MDLQSSMEWNKIEIEQGKQNRHAHIHGVLARGEGREGLQPGARGGPEVYTSTSRCHKTRTCP